jgi:hypothetical protein
MGHSLSAKCSRYFQDDRDVFVTTEHMPYLAGVACFRNSSREAGRSARKFIMVPQQTPIGRRGQCKTDFHKNAVQLTQFGKNDKKKTYR